MKKYLFFFILCLTFFSCEKNRVNEGSDFIFIEGGLYLIGQEKNYKWRTKGEEDKHHVIINDFYISRTEVTNKQYNDVMGLTSVQNDNYPVVNVSWIDAILFCNQKCKSEGIEPYYKIVCDESNNIIDIIINEHSEGYRLPTIEEWEVACRAKTDTPYYTGKKLRKKHANFNSDKLMPVASYPCNKNGLFDMYGNAEEWCHNTAPYWDQNFTEESYRYIKGGSYMSTWDDINSSSVFFVPVGYKYITIGFRIAKSDLKQ